MTNEQQTANVWRQTACILCYVNCGIEVITDGSSIVRVRGDKAHPSTQGYLCQKAQRLNFYQNHADRLTPRVLQRLRQIQRVSVQSRPRKTVM